ncbi:MAG: DUF3014 domain-containing protein [Steroidobacteraceae bacterium]
MAMYAEKRKQHPPRDEQLGRWILGGLALVAIAIGIWFWQKRQSAEDLAPVADPVVATDESRILHPMDAAQDDGAALTAPDRIAALVGAARFASMFVGEDIVRRIVVTVDNLPRQKVATQLLPAQPPTGSFVAVGSEDQMVLGAANFDRYAAWIELVDSLDPDATFNLYRRLYPEFQVAYESLGNPDGYFNDRLVEVIDHLLATPEPPATIALARPNVLYEFADPALAAESAGRKLLLRMGPGNAARVKMKLRDMRDRIAAKNR